MPRILHLSIFGIIYDLQTCMGRNYFLFCYFFWEGLECFENINVCVKEIENVRCEARATAAGQR